MAEPASETAIFNNFTFITWEIGKNIDTSMCLFQRYKGFKKGQKRTPLDSSYEMHVQNYPFECKIR